MKEPKYKLGIVAPIYKNAETGKLDSCAFAEVFGYEKTTLACDCNTKVVYYLTAASLEGEAVQSAINLCPYISENGKYCRLIDGELIEIA